jgi:hypothetical protein
MVIPTLLLCATLAGQQPNPISVRVVSPEVLRQQVEARALAAQKQSRLEAGITEPMTPRVFDSTTGKLISPIPPAARRQPARPLTQRERWQSWNRQHRGPRS